MSVAIVEESIWAFFLQFSHQPSWISRLPSVMEENSVVGAESGCPQCLQSSPTAAVFQAPAPVVEYHARRDEFERFRWVFGIN